ncbi:MAG: protein-export chaperone SecB [Pseudomonadota bacterium]
MADEDETKPKSAHDESTSSSSGGAQIEFNTNGAGPTQNGAAGGPPQAAMLAQYIKDMSFENPNAPLIFQKLQSAKPDINIGINVAGKQVADEAYEVELKIEAKSTADDEPVYIVELAYAALFQLRNIPADQMQPFLLVEAPRLLFPFARRVLSDAVRDGGYPALTLEPIDFAALYQQRMAQAQQGVAPQATV